MKLTSGHFLAEQFEKDFREYLIASINYAAVQEPYKPLSAEDEIKWIKEWLIKYILTLVKATRENCEEEALAQKDKELAEERERVVEILSELAATKRQRGGAIGNIIREADLQLAMYQILHPQRVEVIN